MTAGRVRWQDRRTFAAIMVSRGWTRQPSIPRSFEARTTFTKGLFTVRLEDTRDARVMETIPSAPPDWQRERGFVEPLHGQGWIGRTVDAIEALCKEP